jgi:hypothetical protein
MMNRYTLIIQFVFSSVAVFSQVKSAEDQIREALMAVADNVRQGATVYGYDAGGSFTVLREGTNEIICLADDPEKQGFSVASYHRDLEPFMARGRELTAAGKGFQEIFETRENEVRSGELDMPDKSLLTVMTGKYDESGAPVELYTRYVFYIPYATTESTGLPTSARGPASPWIMDPGTHRAHMMINPPRQ